MQHILPARQAQSALPGTPSVMPHIMPTQPQPPMATSNYYAAQTAPPAPAAPYDFFTAQQVVPSMPTAASPYVMSPMMPPQMAMQYPVQNPLVGWSMPFQYYPGFNTSSFVHNSFLAPYMSYPNVPPGFQLVPISNLNNTHNPETPPHDVRKRRRQQESHPANLEDIPVWYLEVKGWLEYCDRNVVQGQDGENYLQCADALVSNRFRKEMGMHTYKATWGPGKRTMALALLQPLCLMLPRGSGPVFSTLTLLLMMSSQYFPFELH